MGLILARRGRSVSMRKRTYIALVPPFGLRGTKSTAISGGFGTSQFSTGTQQLSYRPNPRGIPAHITDASSLAIAAEANPVVLSHGKHAAGQCQANGWPTRVASARRRTLGRAEPEILHLMDGQIPGVHFWPGVWSERLKGEPSCVAPNQVD
jgi:hypothetical protein